MRTADGVRPADVGILAAVLLLLHAWPVLFPPISTRGEAREGLVVRAIVEQGHWILPDRQGVIASKPPLFHWTAAAVASVVGWSDPVVRLPSVVGAFLLALATMHLGAAIGGRATGWIAAGMLLATLNFWRAASEARVDMLFAACVAGTLVAFWRWWSGGGRAARAGVYGALAAAVLVKGPVGAALCGVVIGAFLVWQRDVGALRRLWSWPLAALAGVIVGGWYAAAYAVGGAEFLAKQVVSENLDRLVGRGDFSGRRVKSELDIQRDFLRHLLPWNLVLLVDAYRRWHGERLDDADRFLHAWWLAILGLFSLAAATRSVYLLPAYPAVAVLAARRLVAWAPPARVVTALLAAMILALGLTVQLGRVRDHRRNALVPFAVDVAARVPDGAPLYAARGLSENDALVLGYLLHRPLERRRMACDVADAYYLGPARAGGDARTARVLASTASVSLLACGS